ncbi:class I SAM-dependent methyltransferase [Leptospira wolffii]|uniref:Class I SAM-dependent methyltransferase n=1 Tax=Leptospira wolffii TaxID=409998 RepID=A0ABV5BSR9_9LEPT
MERDPSPKEVFRYSGAFPSSDSEKSGFADVISLVSSDVGVPTDLSHLYLNSGGEAWANLGFWKESNRYGEACAELARVLGKLGELSEESRVLDLGFGCGEQFRIWQREFGVPFEHLTGLNISKPQYQFAKNKYSDPNRSPELILGGIEKLTAFPDKHFDRVIALDSFYFFPNRDKVVSQIFRILKPGGIFSSTEIFLSDRRIGFWENAKRSLIAWAARMPRSGWTSAEKIIESYSSQGFLFEALERIDPYVFEGFSDFLLSKTREKDSGMPGRLKTRYKILADYLGSEAIKKHFEYWIYKVRRPK